MTEETRNPVAARGSFAREVSEMLQARARELTEAWLAELSSRPVDPGRSAAPELNAGRRIELVRAIAAAVGDPPEPYAVQRIERELTRFARLQRSQGRPPLDLLLELGLLQRLMLDAVLDSVSARAEPVPASTALQVAAQLEGAVRTMAETALRLFEKDTLAGRQVRASLLGTFTRRVTHELRNRVNAARLSLSAYISSQQGSDTELLQNLDASLNQLEDAVGDVFAVALGQSRELESRLRPIADLVDELKPDFDELARSRRVTVRIAQPMPELLVDAIRFQIALLNLVSNAIQRGDRSRYDRWVEIGVTPTGPHGAWRVDVRDNGTGMPQRQLAHGQEQSVEGAAAPEASDRAVGLALAHEAVRQLGGRLWIEPAAATEPTTISFTFHGPAAERWPGGGAGVGRGAAPNG
ncbi:MAG TPA: HAMP domain-containing sensor histidine kinase [Thermoanaerobaculia bacterium]|nr:HAMP domain-containing sensor histidine kinase [Thermoanaerobaculia bacterium]